MRVPSCESARLAFSFHLVTLRRSVKVAPVPIGLRQRDWPVVPAGVWYRLSTASPLSTICPRAQLGLLQEIHLTDASVSQQ